MACYLIEGATDLPAQFLAAIMPALARGERVLWIDPGNRFNAHHGAYAARALGVDPRPALSRVRLARPFNLFQLDTIVRRKAPDLWRGEPIVISDPLPLFHDPDVPTAQSRKIFLSVLDGINALDAPWIVLSIARAEPADRAGWFSDWRRLCHGTNFTDDRRELAGGGGLLEAFSPRSAHEGPGGV